MSKERFKMGQTPPPNTGGIQELINSGPTFPPALGATPPAPGLAPSAPAATTTARKKISPYIDDPVHVDLIDRLLSALRPYGVRRDLSMLVRALLNQAAAALTDEDRLRALAEECLKTPPDR